MAKRRQFSAQFKAKVALEAMRGELSMAELAAKYDVHPNTIAGWKRRLAEEAANVFERGKRDHDQASSPYSQIRK